MPSLGCAESGDCSFVASGTSKDPSMALQYSRENLAIFDFTLSDAEMAALDAYQYQDSHSTLDTDAVIYR